MKITIDQTGRLTGVFLESKGNVPKDAIDVSDEIGSALSKDQEFARYVNVVSLIRLNYICKM